MALAARSSALQLLLAAGAWRCCSACSYFEIKTSLPAEEVVIARTMEFGKVYHRMDWRVVVHPRGAHLDFSNSSGASTYSGIAKYGYVGISFNEPPLEADGMNEAGLSIAAQLLHRSEYQPWDFQAPPAGKKRVYTGYFVAWVLANFASAHAVRDALLSGAYVVASWPQPQDLSVHWAIADAQGNSIVVEFERGQPKVYDNAVGVLTNDPFYPWHVENLNTYAWLSPNGNQNEVIEPAGIHTGAILSGLDFVPRNPGAGFNLGGLPGDGSPPSRFVKAFYLRQISQRNSDPGDRLGPWLTLAQSILNSLWIPMGAESPDRSPQVKSGYTSYTTLRVPQRRLYAFRTYGNLQWHVVDLKHVDFSQEAMMPMPSDFELAMKNVTGHFQATQPQDRDLLV